MMIWENLSPQKRAYWKPDLAEFAVSVVDSTMLEVGSQEMTPPQILRRSKQREALSGKSYCGLSNPLI